MLEWVSLLASGEVTAREKRRINETQIGMSIERSCGSRLEVGKGNG
jgi:hypothetical protein